MNRHSTIRTPKQVVSLLLPSSSQGFSLLRLYRRLCRHARRHFLSAELSAFSRLSLLFRRIKTLAKEMASRNSVASFALFTFVFAVISSLAGAQSLAPAPAPTSDGTSIDQGIAYLLMVVALVLTYLIHPLDASSSYSFF